MKTKRIGVLDVFVIGFAMFAVFFGAGNLIFPPFLGMESGKGWFLGFFCFVLADVGLAILATLVMVRLQPKGRNLLTGLGRIPAKLVMIVVMLCVGPMLCIPRTGATTFEMAIHPLLPDLPAWAFSPVFFGIVFLLTMKPSSVVDIIGKILTPMLLATLAVLVVKGIVDPIGEIGPAPEIGTLMKTGFLAGYQTMDVLGAMVMAMLVAGAARQKGYIQPKKQFRVICLASVVAAACLFTVYGGLTYLGATTSMIDVGGVNQAGLVVLVTELLLKRLGVYLLAMIVFFACLTTAVGLVSSTSEFFSGVFKKVPYPLMTGLICLSGALISVVGISSMIRIATPILNIIYPLLLTQIVLSIFHNKIHKSTIYKGAALGALLVCVPEALNSLGFEMSFLRLLPLSELGFAWVLPAAAGAVVGALLPSHGDEQGSSQTIVAIPLLHTPARPVAPKEPSGEGDTTIIITVIPPTSANRN